MQKPSINGNSMISCRLMKLLVFACVLFLSGCSTFRGILDTPAQEQLIETPSQEQNNDVVDPVLQSRFDEALNAMKTQDYQRAIQLFSEITQQYPKASGAPLNIGIAYQHLGQLDNALKYVSQATQVNNQNYVAFDVKGQILRQQGKFKEAEQAYVTSMNINKSYANVYLNAGILADLYLHDLKRARQYYQQYLTLSGGENKKIEGWLIDIDRRIK